MTRPSAEVLDLFAVPDDVEALPGGRGSSVRAGDLVLSPGRDQETAVWLNPVLARLAVRLDEDPRRPQRGLRLAMPVPSRDGRWVVDGWGASRFEPGTTVCRDLEVTLAAGRLLHAELASVVTERPAGLDVRTDRWALAERAAFAESARIPGRLGEMLTPMLDDSTLGPDQLVHADLVGNVLLDVAGAPVVIDVSPAWRPVVWAEAVAVLDAVTWDGAPLAVLQRWTSGRERQAMLRAVAFRALSDPEGTLDAYGTVLSLLSSTAST